MKIEIGKDFPQYFKPLYPEEFGIRVCFLNALVNLRNHCQSRKSD